MIRYILIVGLAIGWAYTSIKLCEARHDLRIERGEIHDTACFCDSCAPLNYPADKSKPHYGTEWVEEK